MVNKKTAGHSVKRPVDVVKKKLLHHPVFKDPAALLEDQNSTPSEPHDPAPQEGDDVVPKKVPKVVGTQAQNGPKKLSGEMVQFIRNDLERKHLKNNLAKASRVATQKTITQKKQSQESLYSTLMDENREKSVMKHRTAGDIADKFILDGLKKDNADLLAKLAIRDQEIYDLNGQLSQEKTKYEKEIEPYKLQLVTSSKKILELESELETCKKQFLELQAEKVLERYESGHSDSSESVSLRDSLRKLEDMCVEMKQHWDNMKQNGPERDYVSSMLSENTENLTEDPTQNADDDGSVAPSALQIPTEYEEKWLLFDEKVALYKNLQKNEFKYILVQQSAGPNLYDIGKCDPKKYGQGLFFMRHSSMTHAIQNSTSLQSYVSNTFEMFFKREVTLFCTAAGSGKGKAADGHARAGIPSKPRNVYIEHCILVGKKRGFENTLEYKEARRLVMQGMNMHMLRIRTNFGFTPTDEQVAAYKEKMKRQKVRRKRKKQTEASENEEEEDDGEVSAHDLENE